MTNKKSGPGRRTQVEAERTRRRILDRAERLFARKGYRGVSLRELATAAGVRPFTIQHHFGSKLLLYQTVLSRWDDEVLALLSEQLGESLEFEVLVARVVDHLFDLFLKRRDWMALNARVMLGEGLPKGIELSDQSWVRFIDATMRDRRVGSAQLDLGLVLITIEGILHHHVLSTAHYRHLFGKDVTDAKLKARTKTHIEKVILAILGTEAPAQPSKATPAKRRRKK